MKFCIKVLYIILYTIASGSIIKAIIASTTSRLLDPADIDYTIINYGIYNIQLDDRAVSVNDLKLQVSES